MHKTNKHCILPKEYTFDVLRESFVLIARRRVGHDSAEDIAQEACMTVLQKYDSDQHADRFDSWAYQILRNKIGDYLRRDRVRREAIGTHEAIIQKSTNSPNFELRRQIELCLRKLARVNHRYVQILRFATEGYNTSEICKRQGITPQNLYVLLNRSRSALRKCLEGGT